MSERYKAMLNADYWDPQDGWAIWDNHNEDNDYIVTGLKQELAEQIAAAMNARQVWTKEKPTEPGWYWITKQREKGGRIAYVGLHNGELVVWFNDAAPMPVARITAAAWWAKVPEPSASEPEGNNE